MSDYPSLISQILRQDGLLGRLVPTDPFDRDLRDRVQAADDAALLGEHPVASARALALVRGGLLYALDCLDPAHVLFQEDAGDLAGYWHGMLHRREGDFDNARYWFRRAGTQPFFARLHSASSAHSAVMARQSSWDPYLFTGECERAKYGEENVKELLELQRAEFETALEYSWRQAAGVKE